MEQLTDIVNVLINATISFVVLFIISKLMGKKKIAQLDIMDYVVAISIGSIAAEMATETEIPMYYYIISMAIYLVLDLLVNFLARKANFLKKLFRGQPLIIIKDGKIQYNELVRSKLDMNELISLCRLKSIFDINEVAYAIFETNGELSVMPKSEQKPIVAEDLGIKGERASLSVEPVVDGQIIGKTLDTLNKDKAWLFKKLNIKEKKEIKNIAIASYDQKSGKFIVHYKEQKMK